MSDNNVLTPRVEKEFKIGDLFTITPTKWYKENPKSTEKEALQISNTTAPNGIKSIQRYPTNNDGNVITFSDTTIGGSTIFYQPVGFIGYSHVQKMEPINFVLNKRRAFYIISVMRKAVDGKYDYGTKFNRESASNTIISLPVTNESANTDSPEPDWSYMEDYIASIEKKFLQQVETVNAREQALLAERFKGSKVEPVKWGEKEFKVGDIFDIFPGKRVTKDSQIKGNIPYITAVSVNNGIDSYISNPIETFENALTVNFFGDCFYHPYKFGIKDGTYALIFKDKKLRNKTNYLYMISALEKITKNLGSYSKMLTGNIASEILITLPITEYGEIDWQYMQDYIAYIEQREREKIETYVSKKKSEYLKD